MGSFDKEVYPIHPGSPDKQVVSWRRLVGEGLVAFGLIIAAATYSPENGDFRLNFGTCTVHRFPDQIRAYTHTLRVVLNPIYADIITTAEVVIPSGEPRKDNEICPVLANLGALQYK